MSEIAVKEKEEVIVEEETITEMCCEKDYYKLTIGKKVYIAIKSFLDWNIALLLLLLLSPFWIILAIIIRIDTKGSPIFKQKRVGKNRKEFKCCKWRSMTCAAPKYCATRELNESATYITKVGNFIRKT